MRQQLLLLILSSSPWELTQGDWIQSKQNFSSMFALAFTIVYTVYDCFLFQIWMQEVRVSSCICCYRCADIEQ